MDTVLALLFLASSAICVIGLLKPSWAGKATRGQVFKFYGLGAAVFLFLFALFMDPVKQSPDIAAVSAEQISTAKAAIGQTSTVTKPVAHEYQIIDKNDTSFAGRKRLRWIIISPSALSQIDRAETAKVAAMDLQKQTGADLAQIWLEVASFTAGQGSQLAMATYIPDGCGNSGKDCDGKNWNVSASGVQLTDEQMAIWKAWRENREQFMPDGYVDEERLKEFLATKFDTTPDKITLPWIERDDIAQ
ncbi:DUF4875 domain-containing protein [Shewanella sp. HN-41]|uniref:DUF4875 domain-containing protein n=1 Tax=Shewanella sp. HN-41 TaxID=327275 RepID=UPI0002125827|nr:DUF4875 domain-containing protein [Shewanella sp. HN-41]EGM68727.1 hypothetical protein SOHN41_03066 [Shewanella sp. HN-41]